MEHIGIDLGSKDSQVCVRNEGGESVEERRVVPISAGHSWRPDPHDFRAIDVRLLHAGAFEVPVAASNAVIAATATELREKSTTLMIVFA